MKVHGTCHCGQIVYEADVDPALVSLCNCTDCQVLSGSAFRVSVPAPRASFVLLAGQPRHYTKIADSGRRRVHAFCGNCASPVYACKAVDQPATYFLRVGSLQERALLPPQRQIWCRSALAWVRYVGELPGVERQ